MASQSPGLTRVSPAAQAFFAALDSANEDNNNANSSENDADIGTQQPRTFVQRRIQQLGWRNRYSQSDQYPISLKRPNDASTTTPCCHFSVRQVQRGEIEHTYGTGATVWPASVVLIKYLERRANELVQGKRVIDLGAGTGVTSIAAACLGARHVVCTDGEESVVQLLRDNLFQAAKQLSEDDDDGKESLQEGDDSFRILNCRVDTQKYWWGSDTIRSGGNACDLVLVSDCVLPKLYPIAPLVEALDELLQQPGSVAILSYEYRYYPLYDPKEKFCELARNKSLLVETVPLEEQDPVYSVEDIEIWRVQRMATGSE